MWTYGPHNNKKLCGSFVQILWLDEFAKVLLNKMDFKFLRFKMARNEKE